jgi:hypothetical protein
MVSWLPTRKYVSDIGEKYKLYVYIHKNKHNHFETVNTP